MPRPEIERAAQQSVLDRLMDGDPPTTWEKSVAALKASVRRDLEWLLNTRRIMDALPDHLEEVRHSVYQYGLPDITSMSPDDPRTPARLLQEVERTIAAFEPRLTSVHVSQAAGGDAENRHRQLRFRIDALLRLEPTPEQVVFDTVIDPASGGFQVRGDGGA